MSEQKMRERVIKGLQEAVDWLSTETSLTVVDQWVVRDALAVLKAQEPVEPTIGRAVEHDGHDSWWYQCGKCEKPIDWQDNYCRHCGKPVKWE